MPRRVTIWLVTGVLLAGCGGGPDPVASPSARPSTPTPSASPTPTPTPIPSSSSTSSSSSSSSSKPSAGKRADDVNGDGLADLVVESRTSDGLPFRTVLRGSRRGLDPERRTSATSETTCFLLYQHDNWAADLDGDGSGDLLGAERMGEDRSRPCVVWGPRALTPGKAATPVAAPDDVMADRAVVGDFDGDGHPDVAMPAGSFTAAELVVLYGPFGRDGRPARRTVQPSPSGDEFAHLTAGPIGRAAGLVVRQQDDGEQPPNWLLRGGPDGLERAGRKLNAGMSAAFGDFDGDGAADVAIGDNGSRNNEPGYETEPPSVHRKLTVYYGDGRTGTLGDTAGTMAAGDFDGDGRDDLAFGGGHEYTEPQPVLIFPGGPDGLGPGVRLDGVGEARPRTAGDFDGDGDDELVLAHGDEAVELVVSDGKRVLSRFTV